MLSSGDLASETLVLAGKWEGREKKRTGKQEALWSAGVSERENIAQSAGAQHQHRHTSPAALRYELSYLCCDGDDLSKRYEHSVDMDILW